MTHLILSRLVALSALVVFSASAFAQESSGEPGKGSRGANPLKNLYFGEQHLHTENSPDAFVVGTGGSWEDAYNWAMGKEITLSTTGEKIRKSTPYDFIGITDHAEYLGILPSITTPGGELYDTEAGRRMRDPAANADPANSAINKVLSSLITNTPMRQFTTPALLLSNWDRYVETANRFNKPGKFTTLIAWEWTSIPNGRNMHRNVFFRDGGPAAPFTSFDSIFPQDLWTFQEINRRLGHDSIAIPHNGNVSDGWMFSHLKFLGLPMGERYAARQQLNEPLTEIIQTKGSSDTHPAFSPNDEFANFELFPNLINVGRPGQIRYSYIRQGLGHGLILEDRVGTNPYKMGFVSGADSHSAYSPNEEFNFHGTHAKLDDTPAKRLSPMANASGDIPGAVGSAGATAVWAEENTREAIFDAMKRRETYGTSGPLIRLRFFGGWNYDDGLVTDPEFVSKAYAGGVPMGSDLPPKPDQAKAPVFAIWALKDVESGNLDRVQVIKVLVDKWNRPDERIYDIALSDGRVADPDTGIIPPVGNTVHLATATYTNAIGDSQFAVVWSDPDFDPAQSALYYLRVLEIPTPRWSTYDAARNNLPLPKQLPATIQERAWSSPIWYTPAESVEAGL
jgi:hypothetical protein